MTNSTPKANRVHISIFGRRNVGKSSFINAFLGQDLSIVSDTPGTTTDPVEKAYELQPFGPVVIIDTAGIDDEGVLGKMRIEKTGEVIKRTDLAVLIIEPGIFADFELQIINLLKERNIPYVTVINKIDLIDEEILKNFLQETGLKVSGTIIACSSLKNIAIDKVKESLLAKLDEISPDPPILSDLVTSPDVVLLVVPIDKEAPKGRLILPQVQTIRELLDVDIPVVVVKDKELKYTIDKILSVKPALVVTDSQVFLKVDADVPDDIKMTSFSILFARQKGDLEEYVKGVKTIENLKDGDKILIAELCSHRPLSEDIGRVKIPRWLKQYTGKDLIFEVGVGKELPRNLSEYALIIQCGGCVVNRRLIISRMEDAKKLGVPVTNYGVCISYLHGIMDRALLPFEELL